MFEDKKDPLDQACDDTEHPRFLSAMEEHDGDRALVALHFRLLYDEELEQKAKEQALKESQSAKSESEISKSAKSKSPKSKSPSETLKSMTKIFKKIKFPFTKSRTAKTSVPEQKEKKNKRDKSNVEASKPEESESAEPDSTGDVSPGDEPAKVDNAEAERERKHQIMITLAERGLAAIRLYQKKLDLKDRQNVIKDFEKMRDQLDFDPMSDLNEEDRENETSVVQVKIAMRRKKLGKILGPSASAAILDTERDAKIGMHNMARRARMLEEMEGVKVQKEVDKQTKLIAANEAYIKQEEEKWAHIAWRQGKDAIIVALRNVTGVWYEREEVLSDIDPEEIKKSWGPEDGEKALKDPEAYRQKMAAELEERNRSLDSLDQCFGFRYSATSSQEYDSDALTGWISQRSGESWYRGEDVQPNTVDDVDTSEEQQKKGFYEKANNNTTDSFASPDSSRPRDSYLSPRRELSQNDSAQSISLNRGQDFPTRPHDVEEHCDDNESNEHGNQNHDDYDLDEGSFEITADFLNKLADLMVELVRAQNCAKSEEEKLEAMERHRVQAELAEKLRDKRVIELQQRRDEESALLEKEASGKQKVAQSERISTPPINLSTLSASGISPGEIYTPPDSPDYIKPLKQCAAFTGHSETQGIMNNFQELQDLATETRVKIGKRPKSSPPLTKRQKDRAAWMRFAKEEWADF
ncbi:hypothetical protein H072_7428 [Dactylellina haptotyla CBS 200.50]|uniref:Uncharacterized protein n=1 Tax=Dactylellina haptotyla (strain CBS 200.50) TaxID=1284197 RepID=S8BHI3_DACHA|nr:hypothetical protein H072_7428 [Dactylellina haptotyla CBS 200.50]